MLDNGICVFLSALKYYYYSNSIILLYDFFFFRDLYFLWPFQKVVKNLPRVEQMLRFVVLSLHIKCFNVCYSGWEVNIV